VVASAAAALLLTALFAGLDRRGPRTAFAGAPPGTYAVVVRGGEVQDSIFVVPLATPDEGLAAGTVDHIPGWTTTGTVSPDGRTAAMVVIEGGSPSRPVASLVFLDLETGRTERVLTGIDPRQVPPWDPAGTHVAVARSDPATGEVALLTAGTNGESGIVATLDGVAGLYPFAIDAGGDVWSCAIGSGGSTLLRGDQPVRALGPYVTRDWVLSPDDSAIAYIEVNTDGGVHYYPRLVELAGPVRQANTALAGPQALGVAWRAGDPLPTFGRDPELALTAGGGGFDVPLGYSPSGAALAVAHWTGQDYDSPGEVSFQALTDAGRARLEPASRFLGWAER